MNLKTIDDNLIACINKGLNELSDIEFLLRRDEFLDAYEKKFGERLKEGVISPNCRKLFEKEELDYNFVPVNNKKEALDKIKRYDTLLLDEGLKNNAECLDHNILSRTLNSCPTWSLLPTLIRKNSGMP